MMQVSTLYAQSLERQIITRRSQIIQNISRNGCSGQMEQNNKESVIQDKVVSVLDSDSNSKAEKDKMWSDYNLLQYSDVDSKECTDRLCRLPSQCKGGHILGAPRRSSVTAAARLCQSAGNLNVSSHMNLLKGNPQRTEAKFPCSSATVQNKKSTKKGKEKDAKKLPSNFMLLGSWTTRPHNEKMIKQVQSGDILEFNIKLHHHWGIAIIPKNKKPTLDNVDLIHLVRDKEDRQKVVRQPLKDYWHEGVTARINNSRDVHKPPNSAKDVTSLAIKLIAQPYRIWQNSEQMVTMCRYGDGLRERQLSDAARWGSLSKCVGLWLTLTSNSSSPLGSPGILRRRTASVTL